MAKFIKLSMLFLVVLLSSCEDIPEEVIDLIGDELDTDIVDVYSEFNTDDYTLEEVDISGLTSTEIKGITLIKDGDDIVVVVYYVEFTGYKSNIEYVVGIDLDGVITGYKTLSHDETANLGELISREENWTQFSSMSIQDAALGNYDGLTGATTTTDKWTESFDVVFDYHLENYPFDIVEPVEFDENIKVVFPDFDTLDCNEVVMSMDDFEGTPITNGYLINDEDVTVGVVYYVEFQGFAGEISYIMGIDMDGKITGYKTLVQNDTPGYGAQIELEENWTQFEGMSIQTASLGEFDGLTGATVTTTAWQESFTDLFNYHLDKFPFELLPEKIDIISTENQISDLKVWYTNNENDLNAFFSEVKSFGYDKSVCFTINFEPKEPMGDWFYYIQLKDLETGYNERQIFIEYYSGDGSSQYCLENIDTSHKYEVSFGYSDYQVVNDRYIEIELVDSFKFEIPSLEYRYTLEVLQQGDVSEGHDNYYAKEFSFMLNDPREEVTKLEVHVIISEFMDEIQTFTYEDMSEIRDENGLISVQNLLLENLSPEEAYHVIVTISYYDGFDFIEDGQIIVSQVATDTPFNTWHTLHDLYFVIDDITDDEDNYYVNYTASNTDEITNSSTSNPFVMTMNLYNQNDDIVLTQEVDVTASVITIPKDLVTEILYFRVELDGNISDENYGNLLASAVIQKQRVDADVSVTYSEGNATITYNVDWGDFQLNSASLEIYIENESTPRTIIGITNLGDHEASITLEDIPWGSKVKVLLKFNGRLYGEVDEDFVYSYTFR